MFKNVYCLSGKLDISSSSSKQSNADSCSLKRIFSGLFFAGDLLRVKIGPFFSFFFLSPHVLFVCLFCAPLVAKLYFCGQGLFLALAFQFWKDPANYFVKDDLPRKFQRRIISLYLEAYS